MSYDDRAGAVPQLLIRPAQQLDQHRQGTVCALRERILRRPARDPVVPGQAVRPVVESVSLIGHGRRIWSRLG